jgi:hypothetical protein
MDAVLYVFDYSFVYSLAAGTVPDFSGPVHNNGLM